MVAISSLTRLLTYAIGVCGLVPLFPWLSDTPRLILAGGVIIGIWQDRRGSWQIKPWMQNCAIVPFFLYYLLQFSRSNPLQPVVSMLAIMLAVRLSGEKTVRHSLQIHALALFCLASSSLFDLSPVFLLYLGLLLFMVAMALVLLTFQNQDRDMRVTRPVLRKILSAGLLMPLLAIPLLLFFFPVMPRTQLPLWNFLSPPAAQISGYSDKVETGGQANITETRTLVFRAEMPRLPQQQLYWRGTVFNRVERQRWQRIKNIPAEQPTFSGPSVAQTIYPEPSPSRTLITLDRPATVSAWRVSGTPDGVFEVGGTYGKRITVTALSRPNTTVAVERTVNRPFYLHLPTDIPHRIQRLAADIRQRGKDDRQRLELLESFYRNGNFRYSLRDLPTGDSALETFLFEKRQGHCEFFASSFAILLRAAGIPCRLVGGYLGGEYNELGGYYLVTADRAHVWVEAYIDGSGWQRIDPTGFAINAGEVWGAKPARSLLFQLRLAIDSIDHVWNRSVVNYDFEQQMQIARSAGKRFQQLDPARTVRYLIPYLITAALIVGLLLAVRRTGLFRPREERIIHRFMQRVAQAPDIGNDLSAMGLFEIASAVDNRHIHEFVTIYAAAIYRDRRLTDEEYRRLQELLRL